MEAIKGQQNFLPYRFWVLLTENSTSKEKTLLRLHYKIKRQANIKK